MQINAMRNVLVLAVAVLAAVALASVPSVCADTQEGEFDEDLGEFWSYTIGFSFSGYDAESVTWDFGDGSEPVTAWSVVHDYPVSHTYEDPGVYYVTQTSVNSAGETVAVYKVTVLGYPFIEFESNGGSDVATIHMTSGGINATAAEEPKAPVKDGHTFTGWYTDRDCTQLYDWSQKVTEGMTLYAGWAVSDAGDDSSDDSDGSGTDWVAIALIAIGVVVALIALFLFMPAALIGLIIIAVGIVKFMGVF